jgi:hypothetical protein
MSKKMGGCLNGLLCSLEYKQKKKKTHIHWSQIWANLTKFTIFNDVTINISLINTSFIFQRLLFLRNKFLPMNDTFEKSEGVCFILWDAQIFNYERWLYIFLCFLLVWLLGCAVRSALHSNQNCNSKIIPFSKHPCSMKDKNEIKWNRAFSPPRPIITHFNCKE